MARQLAWGIVSTGSIAKTFAKALPHSQTGRLLAVASREKKKAVAFAKDFGCERAYGSYEELFADPSIDAVYVATPHPMHAEWAIKAANAGKHVLCEKPLGINVAQAMAIVEAARRNNVFLMEAFMYRCHPQTARIVECIQEGALGDVRVIEATFSFDAGFRPDSRLLANEFAGGGILDVGCYTVSMSRLIAGVAQGKPFADPVDVKGIARLGETGVDEWAAAVLKFPGDVIAHVSTGVRCTQDNMLRVWGSDGHLIVPTPWIPSREGGTTKIIVQAKGAKAETTYEVATDEWLYAIEADSFAKGVETGKAPWPAMSTDDTLGNIRTLDRWRESAGLVYDLEKPENQKRPIHGGRLTAPKTPEIPSGQIPGVAKPVSRLVMGCDNQPNISYASVMFDDWFERGGNAFDTAYVYGGASGRSERLLGWWVKNRRIRDKVVIIDKGAHTPFCTPEDLLREHEISLDRLQTDYVDLYIMHRDNLDVPVGEFIDLLNRLVKKGSIRAFGASNWCLDRFRKAQQYAKRKGLKGFAALSNQLSLAEMLSPVWGGCLSAKDAEFLGYLEKTQTPLLPWSSQSRGFFTDRANPADKSDEEMVRCWFSKANWKRRERAYKLAAEKGVEPINIALAWVLSQPFPTFPLIGPRTIAETVSSLKALAIQLTPEEVSWLETGRSKRR